MSDAASCKEKLRELLEYVIPEDVRQEAQKLLDSANATPYVLRSACQRLARKAVESYPRADIAWNPIVDAEKCVGCGQCASFCPHQVYEMQGERAVVTAPNACVILCKHCQALCEAGAISFPTVKTYADFLKKADECVGQSF